MSKRSADQTSLPWIASQEASPVRMSPALDEVQGSTAIAPVSGARCDASSTSCDPVSSSSRTSRAASRVGCARCGGTCTSLAIERWPWGLEPATLAPRIDARASSLLPTPTASTYGTSLNGSPRDGRSAFAGAGKPSLETMARTGLWPTPTAQDGKCGPTVDRQKKGREGTTLRDAVRASEAGPLSPRFVEWLMGYPIGWSDSWRSETPLFPDAPKSREE